VEPVLADCDYGTWAGRTFADVVAEQPEVVRTWLTDLDAAPHGGESLGALIDRIGGWLDGLADRDGQLVAFTHAPVIRAALVHAVGASRSAFWRFDVAPISVTRLRARNGGWTLYQPGWH
jgi:broad specificity phosphatase PhoE